jgi:hypothetical protein
MILRILIINFFFLVFEGGSLAAGLDLKTLSNGTELELLRGWLRGTIHHPLRDFMFHMEDVSGKGTVFKTGDFSTIRFDLVLPLPNMQWFSNGVYRERIKKNPALDPLKRYFSSVKKASWSGLLQIGTEWANTPSELTIGDRKEFQVTEWKCHVDGPIWKCIFKGKWELSYYSLPLPLFFRMIRSDSSVPIEGECSFQPKVGASINSENNSKGGE